MLNNKVVLVTGASSGIGLAIALMAVREGARLVLSDVHANAGVETAAMIRAQGGEAIFVAADVANAEDVEALVAQTVSHYGRLDVACNNAGVAGAAALVADYPLDAWAHVINTNLNGVFHGMKYQIAAMLKTGGRLHRECGLHPGHGGLCLRFGLHGGQARRDRADADGIP